ncbi:regulator of G-protein signaling 22-like [Cetorhinus maximus]
MGNKRSQSEDHRRPLSDGDNIQVNLKICQPCQCNEMHELKSLLQKTEMKAQDEASDLREEKESSHATRIPQDKLWNNSVNLWFDLQEYQRLFYAEIFQPFKLRRQAQFIFATYIVEGAPADVDIDTENRKRIYRKLEPPFEELFDQVENHVLVLLLVPWMHMVEMDMSKFRKVELVKETRHLDSVYFKKLQELQRKILPDEDFPLPVHSVSLIQTPEDVKGPNYWQKVPEEFCNYTLNALIRNRLELDTFQIFLKENLAGMDLKCWLDIEYFRRIPHNEKDNRDIKSKEIKSKYLNRKYFFGPSSPATKVQQHEVMKLAGGWGKLLHDQLSSDVLIEVQKYLKARMERKWLPMFLASPEFAEKHHIQVKMQDLVQDQMLQKIRKKSDALKVRNCTRKAIFW